MIEERPAFDAVPIDLTTTNHTIGDPRTSALHAVSGSGKVAVTLRSGTTTTLYIAQGAVVRCDVAAILKTGTDAVFASAVGDLVALVDRSD